MRFIITPSDVPPDVVEGQEWLFVTSSGALRKRGAIGPGTGNGWTNVGEAHEVTAMASHLGERDPTTTTGGRLRTKPREAA